MARVVHAVLYWAVRAISTLAASCLAAWVLIPLAYKTRGYWAVGGEWLLIAAVLVLVWWLMGKGSDGISENNNHP